MMTKQRPCCARVHSKVTVLKGELATDARKAAYADSRGRPMDRYLANIEETKRLLALAEENVINHEAEHATD
jgi:hypothetical protein